MDHQVNAMALYEELVIRQGYGLQVALITLSHGDFFGWIFRLSELVSFFDGLDC